MKNINTSRALGYLMSGGLCVPAGASAQWHKSALIQERAGQLIQRPVLVPTADVPNNNTTALSAHRVRRT
ncbi:hypothetical protein FKR81_30080 [Lentzea tibetensis]|uniref:Uncharacterized protein n=1 Tax=Lentzea tibetensis TaxID=2591470 RepID=A0A563ELF1_9PSEU|nr:hypothetical protein [Lentzea tibetensis]TWP47929.1 hypothetical protein FKR81_30080 [Lentzea tibetensis]